MNVGLFIIGLILIIMTKENLKRVKAERQSSEARLKDSIITTDDTRPSENLTINNEEEKYETTQGYNNETTTREEDDEVKSA